MNNGDFNPVKAQRRLKDSARQIEEVGAQIIAKRQELILAEAQFMDAKREAFKQRVIQEKMAITAAKEWMRFDCMEAELKLMRTEQELKILIERKEIIVEVLNALKASLRIAEMEIINLKYTQP